MSETTDRVNINSDQDKPTIIYRGRETITTSSVSTYASGFVDIDLKQIRVDANAMVEVFVKDNQTNRTYKMPVLTVDDSNLHDFNAYFYMQSDATSGTNIQALTITILKRGGASTDTYSIRYVVYSTRINKDLDLTS